MMRTLMILGAVGMLATPRPVHAQGETKATPADAKAMYEDVEILRRLLTKELAGRNAKENTFLIEFVDSGTVDPAVRKGIQWLNRTQNQGATTSAAEALFQGMAKGTAFADFDGDGLA